MSEDQHLKMLPEKVVEFVVHAHNAVIRTLGSPDKYFDMMLQEGDDPTFHINTVTQVAKLSGVKALSEPKMDGSIRFYLFDLPEDDCKDCKEYEDMEVDS